MVHADAQCRAMLAADVKQRNEVRAYFLNLAGIFLVGVCQLLECASRIDVVARIDANFLDHTCCLVGHAGIKVDVGHKRDSVAVVANGFLNLGESVHFARALCRQSDNFATGVGNAFHLFCRSLDIVGRCVGHRLNAHGVVAAKGDVANVDHAGTVALIVVHRWVSLFCIRISLRPDRHWP